MDTSDDKVMRMRKLAIYEFGCRNILYLMLLSHCLLSIAEKIIRDNML